MNFIKAFAALFLLTFSLSVFAEGPTTGGALAFVITRSDGTGFLKVEVTESNGKYVGNIYSTGGFSTVSAQLSGTKLNVALGGTRFSLDYSVTTQKDNKIETYRGFFTDKRRLNVKATSNSVKKNHLFEATLGANDENENDQVKVWGTEKSFILESKDFHLRATKIKGQPGGCEGQLSPINNPTQKLADFYCETSGSLEDTFFKRSLDFVAWILPILI